MLSLFLAAIENHDNDDKFIKLYKIYEKRVFGIAFGLTNNQYDAEDASQAAFFALARNIDKIDLENEVQIRDYVRFYLQSLGCYFPNRWEKR
jgi:DNA-directed RNA polymerase specialized sigma24 family protein